MWFSNLKKESRRWQAISNQLQMTLPARVRLIKPLHFQSPPESFRITSISKGKMLAPLKLTSWNLTLIWYHRIWIMILRSFLKYSNQKGHTMKKLKKVLHVKSNLKKIKVKIPLSMNIKSLKMIEFLLFKYYIVSFD